jgi:hypothetical protein
VHLLELLALSSSDYARTANGHRHGEPLPVSALWISSAPEGIGVKTQR